MAKGVLVIGEMAGERADPVTYELLAAARGLAGEMGEEVGVALMGPGARAQAAEAFAFGADTAYVVEAAALQGGSVDLLVSAAQQVVQRVEPRVVLLAKSLVGRDLAPRLAFRLGVGLAQDCLEVKYDAQRGRVLATRPVYGGAALAVVSPTQTPALVSLRPKAYDPLAREAREGKVEAVEVKLDPAEARAKVVKRQVEKAAGVKLEEARVVVSGGRGLGGPEPFETILRELADLLGGAVGASRAAVDAGWVSPQHQVGLTGKTITPDLYITVAISGASQHMAGCSGAKTIVAINKDQEANIFKEARYGVVGDWKKVLPAFVETVRELVKK